MIDEKKLIEDIWKQSNNHATEWSTGGILALIERQPKVGEWIPCSERLPEKDCYCLITTSDGEIDVREYNYSKGWGWDGFERIIAWMPLPEAYKGE